MNAYLKAQQAQRDAANPDSNVFVTANAGSGKTKVLVDRIARLLLAGAKPSAFLCITYTKAAASEM
ncbi:MAG: UvrD-helicase domain-containing protein [Caulobacterales bacterium]